jgi:hypothetical protein
VDPNWTATTIGTATSIIAASAMHLRFCEGLAALKCRAPMVRANTERVYLRLAFATQVYSNHYAPVFTTTNMAAPRMALTLAPIVHIGMQQIVSSTSPSSRKRQEKFQYIKTLPSRFMSAVATTLKPNHTSSAEAVRHERHETRLKPVLQQVIECRHFEEASKITRTVATVRRSEQQKVECIVRKTIPVPADVSATQAASVTQVEAQRAKPWTSHQPVMPTLPNIPDTEVARLTDRVVQQINRRILSERERRGIM